MSSEPPPFQEAARCDVCYCRFNTFRRRHHCRCCGRTLCHEHSSNQMALPQFGLHSCVRVCSDCFNNIRHSKDDQQGFVSAASATDDPKTLLDGSDLVTDKLSRIDINADRGIKTESTAAQHGADECKCGMPLCICEAPEPSKDAPDLHVMVARSTCTVKNSKPKRKDTEPENRGSASNSKVCSVFNASPLSNTCLDDSQLEHEVNGEGLREAVKNGDAAAVKKLLSKGVDVNYCDKQGLSLLHLAAVFNQTDITFALMDHGARVDTKNSYGETPLDCAPITLQYKMKRKVEEMCSMGGML